MKTYIVDASVGVKWFFDEEGKEMADYLIEQLQTGCFKLVVPEIFYLEFASVCLKKNRRGLIKQSDTFKIFERMAELPLERYSDHELSDIALENAAQIGLGLYDATYIALAEIYASPLVTADQNLIRACRNRFDFILPLEELTRVELV